MTNQTYYHTQDELYHFGIPGMKWGVRKSSYSSTGLRSAIARHKNAKVDKSFKKWNENSKKKADAISLGKKANASKMAYEANKGDKSLRAQYKSDNKAYKKALKGNTTYRKGQIKSEVGHDSARKYLSEAKKVKKELNANPNDKSLQKKYNTLMSKHDIDRASARRAPQVAANRSKTKANLKRTLTKTAKAATATAAISAGLYATNKYLSSHQFTLNGKPMQFNAQNVANIQNVVNIGKKALKYV